MKILRIALQEYRCFKSAECDLSRVGIASVVGRRADAPERSNGTGKSSLFLAVHDAPYGWAANDEVQRLGATSDTWVELEFSHRGRHALIRRGFKRNSKGGKGEGFLDFTLDGEKQGEKIGETQAAINDFMGCDEQTFMATAFFSQGEADQFVKTTPAKRKEILGSLLGLHVYDAAKRIADTNAKVVQERVEAATRKWDNARMAREASQVQVQNLWVQDLVSEVGRLDARKAALDDLLSDLPVSLADVESCQSHLADMKARFEQCRADAEHAIATHTRASAQADTAASTLAHRRSAIEAAQAQRASVAASVPEKQAAVEKAEGELAVVRSELNALQEPDWSALASGVAEARSSLTQAQSAITSAQVKIQNLSAVGPVCGTCHQPVSQEHRAAHETEYRESLAEAQRAYGAAVVRLQTAQQSETEAKAVRESRRVLGASERSCEAALTVARAALTQAEAVAEAIASHSVSESSEIERLQAAVAQSVVERDAASERASEACRIRDDARATLEAAASAEVEDLSGSVKRLASRLRDESSRVQVQKADAERGVAAYSAARQRVDELEKELEIIKGQLDDEDYKHRIQSFLGNAFGRNGIQQLIFENVVSEIEAGTVQILETMESEYRVIFRTSTKGGKDTILIDVETPDGIRSLGSFSGGQVAEINIAVRLSLAKVLARRSDVSFGSVFMDEVMAPLDGPARQCFLRVVNLMRSDFEQIFVISHHGEIRDVLESSVVVTYDTDGSTLEVAA